MQQPQFYKTVPVSERPKEEGIYMTKWKGVPAFTEKEFKDGEWQTRFENTGLMTHWLEPIPIPDVEVLRDKMQEIAEATEGWKDGIGSVINRIAREALSQTGDGWVRVEQKLPDSTEERKIPVQQFMKDGTQTIGRYHYKNWSDKGVTHWRPLPSPPQNK